MSFAVVTLLVIIITFAMVELYKRAIRTSLEERIDQAAALVSEGKYQEAMDLVGSDLVLLTDAHGNVVEASANARDLDIDVSSLAEGAFELDEVKATRAKKEADKKADDQPQQEQDEVQDEHPDAQSSAEASAVPSQSPVDNDTDDDLDDEHEADSDDTGEVIDDADDEMDYDDQSEADDADWQEQDAWEDIDDGDFEADDDFESNDDEEDEHEAAASPHGGSLFFTAAYAATPPGATDTSDESYRYENIDKITGQEGPYLVLRRKVSSPDGTLTVTAITSLAETATMARDIACLLALVFGVVFALGALLVWHLVGLALGSVDQMRRDVENVSASDLGRRIPVPTHDHDLAPLAATFNGLLDQLEDAFAEQRRFMSDASHELKSPLAATGIMLETIETSREAVDKKVIEDLMHENSKATGIVRDLLVLARHDENRMTPTMRPLDLADLIIEEAMDLSIFSDVNISLDGVTPVIVQADADLLRHAIHNLLSNAVRYAKSVVLVSCDVDADSGVGRIVVEDDGPGLSPEDRERAFGRFVRLESVPTRGTEGTGLGLPVVQSVIEAQGGAVSLGDSSLGGLCATIELATQD